MIRKDLHVQTEQITLCVSRFLQTDDPKTMTINGEYK